VGGDQGRRPGAEPLAAGGGEAHPAGAMPLPEPLIGEKKKGEAGRSWSRWGVPFMEEPKVAAPLDCRVAAGLQAKLLDGGTPVQGLQSRSSSSRRRLEPEPDRPRATPPLSTSSPPPFTMPNRLHPSSPSPSTPPHRDAKERGCSTGKTSPWKPWTAPPCFLCSRLFRCSSPPPRRRVRSAR
jgi:hypothetical protein